MPKEFLIWTCSIVFAITSIITLLAIVKIISIDPVILKKLFNVVIVEIATAVIVFLSSILKENNTDFVKITGPLNNYKYSLIANQNLNSIFINGACLLASKHFLKGEIYNNSSLVKTVQIKDENHYFSYSINTNEFKSGDQLKFRISINDKNKIVQTDSTIIFIVN